MPVRGLGDLSPGRPPRIVHVPLDQAPLDAYAVPQCVADTFGSRYTWQAERWHRCPWRGRYWRAGLALCGHHVKVADLAVDADADALVILPPAQYRRAGL